MVQNNERKNWKNSGSSCKEGRGQHEMIEKKE
jgi:hypothetical protein